MVGEDRPHVGPPPGKADPPGGSRAGISRRERTPVPSSRRFESPMKPGFGEQSCVRGRNNDRWSPSRPGLPSVAGRSAIDDSGVRAHERRPPPVRSPLGRLDGDLWCVVGGTRGSPADGRLLRRLPPGMRRLLLVRARHPRRRIFPVRLPPSDDGLSMQPRRACRPGHGDRPPHDRRACRLGAPLDRRLFRPDDRPRILAPRPPAGDAAPHARRAVAHLPPPELSPSPGPPPRSAPAAIGRAG